MEQWIISKLEKEYIKAACCNSYHLCLFNFYAKYIMWNARLDETQSRIKIAGGNINNLRYTDDTTLMAENEEELKSLLMKVRGDWKRGLKTTVRKPRSWHQSHRSWQIDGERMETVTDYFWRLQNHCRWWLQPWNEKTLAPWKKSYDKPR